MRKNGALRERKKKRADRKGRGSDMLVLAGKRSEIYALIGANPSATEFLLKVKPGKLLLANLLGKTKVKTLCCSEGIRRTMPENVLRALAETGVELRTIKLKRGRPFAVDGSRISKALSLINKGENAADAAKKAGISVRTLYYRLARQTH